MKTGLHIYKGNSRYIALDPDNLFWASAPDACPDAFIGRDILALYNRQEKRISRAMDDFRFGKELTAVYIDPTDKCNANCAYCYVPKETREKGSSMTGPQLDSVMAKLARYFKNKKRRQVIIFHASEPLLVKDIVFDAIAKYRDVFKFGLQTNATLLKKEDAAFLKSHLVGVGISLDSYVPSTNNKQRPMAHSGGNFTAAVQAIEWFNGYPGLNVISTVTRYNVKELPGMVRFLHAKRVPCVLFNPARFTRVSPATLKPNDKIFAKYFIKAVETAIGLTRACGRKIIVGNFSNTVLAIVAPAARRLMCDISPCGAGRCFFTVTAKGQMIPCGEFTGLKGFSGGDIFKDGIPKAMGSKAFKAIRSRVVEKISGCDECKLRNICGAPCPAELHARGNMYQKAIFCDFYKEVIGYAFKVIAEDKLRYVLRDEPLKNLEYEYNIRRP